jgi:hypothetical protein
LRTGALPSARDGLLAGEVFAVAPPEGWFRSDRFACLAPDFFAARGVAVDGFELERLAAGCFDVLPFLPAFVLLDFSVEVFFFEAMARA